MPYRQPGSPYFWVNRSFKGVGRIQKSTGTQNKRTAQQMEALLSRLYASGKANLLVELREGRFSLPWLYSADLKGDLDTLVSAVTAQPLGSIIGWIEDHPSFAVTTKSGYLSLARKLLARYPSATIHQIPDVLRQFRLSCEAEGVTRSFNQARAMLQGYVAQIDGRYRPLWTAISNIPPIGYQVDVGKSLTYSEVRRLGRDLVLPSTHPDQFIDFRILWSLLLTGMRKSEYLGGWQVAHDRVTLRSAKAKQSGIRERCVPRIRHTFSPTEVNWGDWQVAGPIPPARRFQSFTRHLREVSAGKVSPHDLRHTYRTWLLLAGVPEIRAESYLGHKLNPKNVQKLYVHHDVIPHLSEDASRLQEWLARQEREWFALEYEHSPDFVNDHDPLLPPEVEYENPGRE